MAGDDSPNLLASVADPAAEPAAAAPAAAASARPWPKVNKRRAIIEKQLRRAEERAAAMSTGDASPIEIAARAVLDVARESQRAVAIM